MLLGVVCFQLVHVDELPSDRWKLGRLRAAERVEVGVAFMQGSQKPLRVLIHAGLDVPDQAVARCDQFRKVDRVLRHALEFSRVGLIQIDQVWVQQFVRRAW